MQLNAINHVKNSPKGEESSDSVSQMLSNGVPLHITTHIHKPHVMTLFAFEAIIRSQKELSSLHSTHSEVCAKNDKLFGKAKTLLKKIISIQIMEVKMFYHLFIFFFSFWYENVFASKY